MEFMILVLAPSAFELDYVRWGCLRVLVPGIFSSKTSFFTSATGKIFFYN